MAKISLSHLLNTKEILHHVYFESVSVDDINKLRLPDKTFPDELDMVLTINGIEVNVEKFFNTIWEQYSELIEKEAKNIVKNQSSEVLEEMICKISHAKEALEDAIENINWDLDGKDLKKAIEV